MNFAKRFLFKSQPNQEVTMHVARSIVGALFALAVSAPASAAIREEPVSYKDGDTAMKGFVVYDDAKKAKLLVQNGADDPFIKPDSVEAFKKEMVLAKVNYHYIDYRGAVHAFTNPEATEAGKKFNLPLAYNAAADKQSKAEMAKFFAEIFGRK